MLGAFRLKAAFPELVEGLPFAPPGLILFLLDKIPRFFVSKGECREQTEQMRLSRTKFGLDPVSLANGTVFAFRLVGSGDLTKNVIQKRADRINLKFFYSL